MMTVFRGDALGARGRWRLLIRVCGWHRKTFGYPRVPLGVKRSETWGISHGICAACARAIYQQSGFDDAYLVEFRRVAP